MLKEDYDVNEDSNHLSSFCCSWRPVEPAADQGLKGEYFANMTLAGQPVLTRIEAVNFNWGGASPGDPIGVDAFSVRWTGSLTPPESGSYTFGTRTDDGVRLWVAGETDRQQLDRSLGHHEQGQADPTSRPASRSRSSWSTTRMAATPSWNSTGPAPASRKR